MSTLRTKDSYQKQVYDFMHNIDVVCPACGRQAVVLSQGYAAGNKNEAAIKLICTHCGHNKRLDEKPDVIVHATNYKVITGKYIAVGGSIDPYFHLPLWFTADCCDNLLWAYNREHLDFLSKHVEAKLRERDLVEIKNNSLGSRLPRWMTSKKNRDTILKAITQLKNKT